MSLSPASFSGETTGSIARSIDINAPNHQDLQLVASGNKVSGGRRHKSRKGKTNKRKARKSTRKSRKSRRRSVKKSWFMM